MRYLRLITEVGDDIIPFNMCTLRCVGKKIFINHVDAMRTYAVGYSTSVDASDEMQGIEGWLNDEQSPAVYTIDRTVG